MTTSSIRPVRIGVQIAPQHSTYTEIRDTLASLEELGVDIAFNWDHFYPLSGDPEGTHFEGWSMLAAWAEQTTTIEFGPLVTCNTYRNPDLLADMARTVDHISAKNGAAGRLVFGIGAGWFERDYDEYGYEFGTPGQRLDALAEAMPRIESRWSVLNPPPTRKIPVLIGGGGEKKTLRIVAKHADIWHSFADAETLERKLGILRSHCEEIGRDFDEIEISAGASVRAGVGDTSMDSLEAQHALGATLFTLGITGPNIDTSQVADLLAWRDAKNAE
ncbi:LLM class F420-dependent oxidoreductase [Subtercola sp. Z020]|uniref:LLM class F420-dependent oxidoreductase n=1 Tax=Subtercola sp. Z020 TaxID=2080582 RepID=UPI000CE7B60C|nr:LLM class F420-dependent oxidoreductase [Subtercola sp. Z020]PPF84491.1 LLM class F420-dependent oxidoreductase [Subtercola sp. Z020]